MNLWKTMTEKEPPKEVEIWCAYCGDGYRATWELIIDEGGLFVCGDHRFILEQINVVGLERQIGTEKWTEVYETEGLEGEYLEDIGDWKSLLYNDDQRGKTI